MPHYLNVFDEELTLASTCTAGATSLTVTEDIAAYPNGPVRFYVDDEIIEAQSRDVGTHTFSGLRRGLEGTTAASHAAGAKLVAAVTAHTLGGLLRPFTLHETLPQLTPVRVRTDGAVEKTVHTVMGGGAVGINAAGGIDAGAALIGEKNKLFRITETHWVIVGANSGLYVRITQDGGATWTANLEITTQMEENYWDACELAPGRYAFLVRANQGVGPLNGGTFEVTGSSVTNVTVSTFDASSVYAMTCCRLGDTKMVAAWQDSGSSNLWRCRVATVSGSTLTLGTTGNTIASTASYSAGTIGPAGNDRAILLLNGSTNVYVVTASGTTVTVGAANSVTHTVVHNRAVVPITSDRVIISFLVNSDLFVKLCSVSGTTLTVLSSVYVVGNSADTYLVSVTPTSVLVATAGGEYTDLHGFTVSGDTLTVGQTARDYGSLGSASSGGLTNYAFMRESGESILALGQTNDGTAQQLQEARRYTLGVDDGRRHVAGLVAWGGAAGDVRDVALPGAVVEGLSGLTPGAVYYMQEDMTVTTVESPWPIGRALSDTAMLVTKSP